MQSVQNLCISSSGLIIPKSESTSTRKLFNIIPRSSHGHRGRERNYVEPISKSSEEDDEASELQEAKEVFRIEFPAHEKAALPLNPGEEPFDQPAPCISPKSASILRSGLAAIASHRVVILILPT